MTATPINMHVIHEFGLSETAWDPEPHRCHVPAVPVHRLPDPAPGMMRLMSAGLGALLLCVLLALLGDDLLHYWWALVWQAWAGTSFKLVGPPC
jgi:hypothetical protein